MKKMIYIISILLILGLFFASPYILDVWQNKRALEAAGGLSCTEGFVKPVLTKCVVSCTGGTCCSGGTLCFPNVLPPCIEQDLSGSSAGGQSCGKDYLATEDQAMVIQGSKNVIVGGTTMFKLSVVASEKGCVGCSAAINNPKVYAYKNKVKEIIDFIIAGKKWFK